MAKFTGIPPITGTIGPVCIYKMYGKYFMRTASSLTGKRVKKDPAFRKTMQYAGLLAKASRIASAVYRTLPADRKQHSLYRKLTGEAMTWLKEEWTVEEVLAYLLKMYTVQPVQASEPETIVVKATAYRQTQRVKGKARRQHKTMAASKPSYHLYTSRYLGGPDGANTFSVIPLQSGGP
ncbi:hypothetical protein HB364_19935 [Pseudoflavitalea sp. X16]|uniref:hypothetical protein n=1 Tax=Paraflavitalea devenefica TaxID=2716334 RepID=UPI00141FF29B|nr:hypothetical protein [Paraflavitalea devenefica]NII27370.1 hypothetical protein [Paraflavitalea devenefica]